ncbi:MAG: hypothetical protein NTW05_21895 [Pseudonocardiales bacterium]|nr:hypothetical protein [Pseudonocardiales bacterium]
MQCVEDKSGVLYLPARRLFEASESLDEIEAEVWREVAQTLISNADAFRQCGLGVPSVAALDRWLNDPQFRSGSLGATGFSASADMTANTASGFAESGFPRAVREELERLFPTRASGGVMCVLDDLELLQSSTKAKAVLEALGDRLFNIPQLRWILCGSRGIVSRARSQRLSGFLESPMILGPLSREASVDLVGRRIDLYGGEGATRVPVSPQAFEYLYRALNSNLRDSLTYAQEFAGWFYEEYVAAGTEIPPHADLGPLLESWLASTSDRAMQDARGIQPRVWQFFDALARANGTCRSSDWDQFAFNTQQQLGSSVTALESVNLVVREIDPENASRSLTSITPLG